MAFTRQKSTAGDGFLPVVNDQVHSFFCSHSTLEATFWEVLFLARSLLLE